MEVKEKCGESWRQMNGRKRNTKKWREAGEKNVQREGRVK